MKRQNGSAVLWALIGLVVVFLVGYFLVWLFFMKSVVTEANYESVLIDRPYFFGRQGVRPEPNRSGTRTIEWLTTKDVQVQVSPLTIEIPFEDLPTNDNALLDFKTSIQVQVTDSVLLISTKGENWYANNLERPLISAFRDITKARTMTAILSNPVAAQEMETELLEKINARLKAEKVPVVVLDFNMGQGRPNPEVVAQMNATLAAQQAKQTYTQEDAAQKERAKSEASRALADKAYASAMGFTSEQVVQLDFNKRFSEACTKSSCIVMSGGQVPVTVAK